MDTSSLRLALVLGFCFSMWIPTAASGQSAIPQGNWTLHYTDSQDTVGGWYPATNAFDGDPNTIWVTEWVDQSPPPPHELQIDLGGVHSISGFRYLPRQDAPYGRVAAYEFFVSMDGVTWGSSVTSGAFQNTVQEQQASFNSKMGRYVRLRVVSEVGGHPWAAVAEINVLAGGGDSSGGGGGSSGGSGGSSEQAISQANWILRHTDSQEVAGNYLATQAFDGDPNTLWVSEWVSSSPVPPHEIQIDLGTQYDLTGFRYLPRQDGLPYGRVSEYRFYVSTDGSNWGSAVVSGVFPNTGAAQEVRFNVRRGRYIRFRAMSEVGGNPWTAVAELNVLGTGTGGSSGGGSSGGSGGSSGGGTPPPSGQTLRAVFTPSADHNSLVRHYVLDFFPAGSDPTAANPVWSMDIGKPSISNGEITVNLGSTIPGLWSGLWISTVTAVGDSGSSQSAASPPFSVP
jgi:hypothetical protein